MPANERKSKGHPLGLHRVLDKEPKLPQAASRLDNSLPIYSNEILINVDHLNIDAASFVQMEKEGKGVPHFISNRVMNNTKEFGKQHNQATGSGGMLTGTVVQIGSQYRGNLKLKKGDRIATLVSLTLTPLTLEKILEVDAGTHQVRVEGSAILFEHSLATLLPKNIPEKIAMAALDVAGAPATVNAICKTGMTVVIIGAGGKAGMLSCVAAKKKVGARGKVIGIEPFEKARADLKKLGVCHEILSVDATHPIAVLQAVEKASKGKLADVVVNVASVPNTEMGSVLSAKMNGTVLFFSMATSFSRVALGAEGIVSSAKLLFGNGYFPNHDRFALNLLRQNPRLLEVFEQRYSC